MNICSILRWILLGLLDFLTSGLELCSPSRFSSLELSATRNNLILRTSPTPSARITSANQWLNSLPWQFQVLLSHFCCRTVSLSPLLASSSDVPSNFLPWKLFARCSSNLSLFSSFPVQVCPPVFYRLSCFSQLSRLYVP